MVPCRLIPMQIQIEDTLEGQRLYFKECNPGGSANVILDNTDLGNPLLSWKHYVGGIH
jgi:hypothetical protein